MNLFKSDFLNINRKSGTFTTKCKINSNIEHRYKTITTHCWDQHTMHNTKEKEIKTFQRKKLSGISNFGY